MVFTARKLHVMSKEGYESERERFRPEQLRHVYVEQEDLERGTEEPPGAG